MNSTSNRFQATISITVIAFYCVLTYGFYATKLGFYWDDWAIIYWHYIGGFDGLIGSTINDRPIISFLHYAIFETIGYNPLFYHILTPSLWFLSCCTVYFTLRLVWPDQYWQLFTISLLTAIYPGLSIHFAAVVTYPIFLGYLLSVFSIYFSLKYVTTIRLPYKVCHGSISILLGIIAWQIYEPFFFMEAFRLLLITVSHLRRKQKSFTNHLKSLAFLVWPWLLTQVLYLSWRIFIYSGNRQLSDSLKDFLSDPISQSIQIFTNFVNSIIFVWIYPLLARVMADTPLHILVALCIALFCCFAWMYVNRFIPTTDIGLNSTSHKTLILNVFWPIIIAGSAIAGVGWYTIRYGLQLSIPEPQLLVFIPLLLASVQGVVFGVKNGSLKRWHWQMMLVGSITVLICMILTGLAAKHPSLDNLRDRWNIPSIIGCCLFLVGLISFIKIRAIKIIIVSLMLSSGIIYHYLSAHQFYNDWKFQRSFVWQLWTRAPNIKPGTILVFDPGVMRLRKTLAYYSMFGLTSTAYGNDKREDQVGQAILGRGKDKGFIRNLDLAQKSRQGTRAIIFPVDWSRPLVMSMDTYDSCLNIIDGRNPVYSPNSSQLLKKIGNLSNLDNIISSRTNNNPPELIFGYEPHNWCYYYQRAQLAKQNGNWPEIVKLYKQAKSHQMSPKSVFELIPFIEGFARTGDTAMANKLAEKVLVEHNAYKASMEALK